MNASLLNGEIKACTICKKHLPLKPKPIFSFSAASRILIIGQAPGLKAHISGIPWDDASGRLLREWMGINDKIFYDAKRIALVPMGFCYPGKGPGGDLPPRPECAPLWHTLIFSVVKKIELKILIGQYSQKYYLAEKAMKNLTENVKSYKKYLPEFFPLPHPSPRNRLWLKRNPWFEEELLPVLKKKVKMVLE